MKILLVEDDHDFGARLEQRLLETDGVSSVFRAADKASALNHLPGVFFDLVILDLSIPSDAGEGNPQSAHGIALFEDIQNLSPGTPIYILTGSAETRFSRRLASRGNQERLWGSAERFESVSYFAKEEVLDLLDRVALIAQACTRAKNITINTRGIELNLSEQYRRIFQSFAIKAEAVMCDVTLLGGGLSDTSVFKVVAKSAIGRAEAICAAKLGNREKIAVERIAFDRYVTKLGVGHCPAIFYAVDNAVGSVSGIFYTLADQEFSSFFDYLAHDPARGHDVVKNTRVALSRWDDAAELVSTPIRDIRRRIISDAKTSVLIDEFGLNWLEKLEDKAVYANRSCIHGDLHCGNVLARPDGQVAIIDYDDVGLGHSAADPVNLELSLIFHPEAVKLGLSAPLQEVAEHWPDISKFVDGSTLKTTLGACRTWLHDVAGSDDAALAAALAFAIRQLRYDTVDQAVTLTLINAIRLKLDR